jgi:class 3 adenylate cyclase/tetratricopeptide (TPR) repeat protein
MACATALVAESPAPHAARKTVTVLFCDVVGSTPLSERLDAESMREVMSRFFREMRTVLERHGGTVEKFIGDAVMAVFGVPLLHEDDALRAVRAAADMRDALAALNTQLETGWDVSLRTRIGVNTGEVVVGDPAAGQALVVGDAVILAARLEQAAPVGEILLGPETYALVRDHVGAEATEPLEVRGKRHPVVAYRLVDVQAGPAPFEGRPDPPLVDRHDELVAIGGAFDRAVEARGCELLTILGSAGVGKSRLAREFEAGIAGRAIVLRTRCLSYGEGITFWPVAELVRQACAITTDDSRAEAWAKIEAGLEGAEDGALIAERVAAVTGFAAASTGLQEAFWAIRRFLEWLGRTRPLVVIVDDIQWAESTFLDLLEYLAGWSREVALLLLCLARPDLLDERPAWGSGADNAGSLHLLPFGDEESAELIAGLLDGMRLTGPAMRRITDSAGGNPLFVEEMLRMLEDDGLLRRSNGGWVVAGDLSDLSVPASISALLGARLDRLSAGELAVVRCAAVIGKVFWWGPVEELAPADVRSQVGSHLQTLVHKDLIRPERSSLSGEDAFRFHHTLLQDAAYTGTPKEMRADLHQRFAGWVERAAGERVVEVEEMIGYHLEQAYRYRTELGRAEGATRDLAIDAARRLAVAGRRAATRGDMPAAADLLSRAAALFPEDHPERRAMLPDLGEVLSEAGDLAGADAAVAEAAELAERFGDHAVLANATIMGLLLLESTDPKRRSEGLERVGVLSRVLEALGDELGLARAQRLLGDIHWAHCRYGAADGAFERALEHARRAGATWEEAYVLGQYTGSGVYGPAPTAEAARRCEDVLAQSGGMGFVEARALRALASIRAMEGRFDEARELATRARTILEELGTRLRAAFISDTLGFIETMAGDHAAAERELRAGYDTVIELGERGFQATIAAELAHALVAQGRLEDAEVLAKLSEDIGAVDDMATQVMWRSARARIQAARGLAEEAEELVREAVALADETDDLNMRAETFVALAEVLAAAGREPDAAEALTSARGLYERKANVAGAAEVGRRLAALVLEA